MLRIALTGGIAAGKTLVADEFGRLGAVVIDADVLAHQVVEPGSAALQEIVARFGQHLLHEDGTLDRSALGDVVFGDTSARLDLNGIVHPRVRAAAGELEAAAPGDAVVIHVIPLLVETNQQDTFDAVLVVDVPVEVQVERLVRRRGLTEVQARDRVASQAPRSERLAAADWVIENSADADAARHTVRELWNGPITRLRTSHLG